MTRNKQHCGEFFGVTAILLIVVGRGQGMCPKKGWGNFSGFCYSFFLDRQNKSQAADTCHSQNSSLIDVQSPEESAFAVGLLPESVTQVWLGMTNESGRRFWDRTGLDVNFARWDGTHPMPSQMCAMLIGDNEIWWSEPCHFRLSFICKKAVKCQAHELGPNMKSKNRNASFFQDGQGVTYTCNHGYSFSASNPSHISQTVQCQSNGALESAECTDADECLAMCKNNATCKNTIGSYRCACDAGYDGNETKDGCQEILCNITSNDPNLIITPNTNPAKWNDTVSFSCNSSYVLVNLTTHTSTCTGEGQNGWNVPFPRCKSATTTSPPLTSPTGKGNSSMTSSSTSLPALTPTHSTVDNTTGNETSSSGDDKIIIVTSVACGVILTCVFSCALLRNKYIAEQKAKKPAPVLNELEQLSNVACLERAQNDYEHIQAGGLNGERPN